MTPRPPRFLVLRGGAIGDFVVTLPVLQALRTRWPDAEIELIGYPHIAHLALASGLVKKVHSLDKAGIARLFAHRPSMDEDLRLLVESFDVVISFLHDPDGVVQTNLLTLGADLIYRSPVAPQIHAVDHLIKALESMAIYEAGSIPCLSLDEPTRAGGRAWLAAKGIPAGSPAFAVHAGSGSPKKNWPLDRFVDVAKALHGNGITPVFVVGEADRPIEPVLRAAASVLGPVLSGLSLTEVAGVLSCCAGYLGNDSGITHIAAATGIPTVAVFGPTDPSIWGPRGRRVQILQASSRQLEDVPRDEVLAAIQAMV